MIADTGLLPVGDGTAIWFSVSGNPKGTPILLLHGGPGSGGAERLAIHLDPEDWRIIVLDQRGCGRSTPHASTPDYDPSANTTAHLIADINHLLDHLGIESAALFGHSWGTTLALAFAERQRQRVSGLLLVGVTTTRQQEIDWLYVGMRRFYPAQWQDFRAHVPEAPVDELLAAYRQRLFDPDAKVRAAAALAFHRWEAAGSDGELPERWRDPDFRLARSRIITHYLTHAAWLADNELIANAGCLSGLPGELVQGRLDLEAPALTAWELAKAWPDAELTFVENGHHSTGSGDMADAMAAAAVHLRKRLVG